MTSRDVIENRTCQNCNTLFPIYDSDVVFYDKIGVPKPTFCPECRMIRRTMWRNMRSLHRRICDICKKTLISMYKDDGVSVHCQDCSNSTHWDPKVYGKEYDETIPFFEQAHALFKKVPRLYRYVTGTVVDSEYTNYTANNNKAYLSYSVIGCENVAYSDTIDGSKNSMDCLSVRKVDLCYWNVDGEGNYNSQFLIQSQNCIDSKFLFDCVNCQNCFLSSNLRNQSYVFKNKKLSKEEYEQAISDYELSTFLGLEKARSELKEMIEHVAIHRYAQIYSAQNSFGENISNSKNIYVGFDVQNGENLNYVNRILNIKDSYDLTGAANAEFCYECMVPSFGGYKNISCYITLGSKECEYSFLLKNCTNCFGCVGLTNSQYCILNKQYSKEAYFELVDKIKKEMITNPYIDSQNRQYGYGEFFPYEFCPFGYNETVAHDYFTISESFAKEKGYNWYTREKPEYKISILSDDLEDGIEKVTDDVLNETIGCPNNGNADFQCTTAYRITTDELLFYRQKGLPLPRKCPNCRHYERLAYRNQNRLYTRTCMFPDCGNTFETTYAPNRTEKVYCEACYKREVL